MALEIWDSFKDGIFQYSIDAYNSVDPFFWPLIFLGIIGYLYAGMESVTIAVIGILITFALFGGTTSVFENVPEINLFLYIIAIVGIAMLITAFVIRKGKNY